MPSEISMTRNTLSRRGLLSAMAATTAAFALPRGALALTVDEARALIDSAVADVNSIISSGQPEAAMLKRFEDLFVKYADVAVIARSALGPAARTATPAQLDAFAKAYQHYISYKYGRRFREFIGGRIEVTGAEPVKSYYEVVSMAYLQGSAPFELRWQVSDKSGRKLFFNLIIEGVNMLASERTEVGAILDQNGGDIDKLVAKLNAA
ncbi:MAG: ABC transporter substrate-binding protein [Rhodobacteraceae bacterium]|nr:ABC transporter substrate-binding protein [Paracoccaceae bacterium]